MNIHGIRAIYIFEMRRFFKTLGQSILSPVLSTTLYFVVFGSAIGSAMVEIDGISYGAFIIPRLIMLTLLSQSISNASFGIYFPRFTGTIYEILSAPLSPIEIVTGYVGAAATKSVFIGILILVKYYQPAMLTQLFKNFEGVPPSSKGQVYIAALWFNI